MARAPGPLHRPRSPADPAIRGDVLELGKVNAPGVLSIADQGGHRTVLVTGSDATATLGREGNPGRIELCDEHGDVAVTIAGRGDGLLGVPYLAVADAVTLSAHGALALGGGGTPGGVIVSDRDGETTIQVDGDSGRLRASSGGLAATVDGRHGRVTAGDAAHPERLRLGMVDDDVQLAMTGPGGDDRVFLSASRSGLCLGGKDAPGDIRLFATTQPGDHDPGKATIHLDGGQGDILLRNADCAEEFEAVDDPDIVPGSVVVIGPDGRIRHTGEDYDPRVCGIVSGAGDFRPALVLDRRADGTRRLPVALAGKVCCLVDARDEPVRAGDLLTSASRPGHARRASDRSRTLGAIVGKALAPLAEGTGLVPVLVWRA